MVGLCLACRGADAKVGSETSALFVLPKDNVILFELGNSGIN